MLHVSYLIVSLLSSKMSIKLRHLENLEYVETKEHTHTHQKEYPRTLAEKFRSPDLEHPSQ